MTGMQALALLGGIMVLEAGFGLPVLAATSGGDPWLKRGLVRRFDRRGLKGAPRLQPSLLEAAADQARCSYGGAAVGATAVSARFVLDGTGATITSRAVRGASTAAARTSAFAVLAEDYPQRYRAALGDEAGRRGLEVRECWIVAAPARPRSLPAIVGSVTTWLEVGPAGSSTSTRLVATEAVLVGGRLAATVTATGLDPLSHDRVLDELVARVAGRLPMVSDAHVIAAHADWLVWPHGA